MAAAEVDTANAPEVTPEPPEDEVSRINPDETEVIKTGTILEAAFVDPAYSWPPSDGQGKNAIELEAAPALLDDDEATTQEEKEAMKMPPKPTKKKRGFWNCCRADDAVVYDTKKAAALQARKDHEAKKKAAQRSRRRKERFSRVPEGILIYRLDTSTQTIELMSDTGTKTNMDTLLTSMVIASASPSSDATRRGMDLVGIDGQKATLVACEQRTAIAWLEAMDMMLGNKQRTKATRKEAKSEGSKVGLLSMRS